MDKRLAECQRVIGYHFANLNQLEIALTHSSLRTPDRECNERLEFLGDSVLGLVITEELYRLLPDQAEGELTRIKSAVVSRGALYRASTRLGLARFAEFARGVGRRNELPVSVIANLVESVIGAIYLDAGYFPAREFVLRHLGEELDDTLNDRGAKNYKSLLQHDAQQATGGTPHYRVVEEDGPHHSKHFTAAAVIGGQEWGRGSGATKKEAEQEAARKALAAWQRRGRGRRRRGGRKPAADAPATGRRSQGDRPERAAAADRTAAPARGAAPDREASPEQEAAPERSRRRGRGRGRGRGRSRDTAEAAEAAEAPPRRGDREPREPREKREPRREAPPRTPPPKPEPAPEAPPQAPVVDDFAAGLDEPLPNRARSSAALDRPEPVEGRSQAAPKAPTRRRKKKVAKTGEPQPEAAVLSEAQGAESKAEAPKPRRTRKRKAAPKSDATDSVETAPGTGEDEPAPKPRRPRKRKATKATKAEAPVDGPLERPIADEPEPVAEEAPKPARKARTPRKKAAAKAAAPEPPPADGFDEGISVDETHKPKKKKAARKKKAAAKPTTKVKAKKKAPKRKATPPPAGADDGFGAGL